MKSTTKIHLVHAHCLVNMPLKFTGQDSKWPICLLTGNLSSSCGRFFLTQHCHRFYFNGESTRNTLPFVYDNRNNSQFVRRRQNHFCMQGSYLSIPTLCSLRLTTTIQAKRLYTSYITSRNAYNQFI